MRFTYKGSVLYEQRIQEANELSHNEATELLLDLIDHLELEALRTNATESGAEEILIRPR